MTSKTVIHCFNQLFSLFGMPEYIHNDRAPDFLSDEVKQYLNSKGIATSRNSRYNPRGNGQIERYNGIVLPDALHSIRSLLCTATNATSHERLFHYNRKSTAGSSMPSWLTHGPVYVRKHVRNSKYDPIVEEAELIHANPQYAFVKLKTGHETTVSLRDVAPCNPEHETNESLVTKEAEAGNGMDSAVQNTPTHEDIPNIDSQGTPQQAATPFVQPPPAVLSRPVRNRKPKTLFADSEHSTL